MRTAAAAALRSPTIGALTLRIVLAAALAGLVGIEREVRGGTTGFRIDIVVAVGAALFTLAGA